MVFVCGATIAGVAIGGVALAQTPFHELAREALAVAGQPPPVLQRFHTQYVLDPGGGVDRLEAITAFRGAVLEAQRSRDGGAPLDVETLAWLLAARAGTLRIIAVVDLDPLHSYVRTPSHSVVLLTDGGLIGPAALARTALGPRRTVIPPSAVGGGVSVSYVEVEADFRNVRLGEDGCCRAAVLNPAGRTLAVEYLPDSLR
jgi:hypothetical protein